MELTWSTSGRAVRRCSPWCSPSRRSRSCGTCAGSRARCPRWCRCPPAGSRRGGGRAPRHRGARARAGHRDRRLRPRAGAAAGFRRRIAASLRRGRRASCRCFGAADTPVGPRHLARNTRWPASPFSARSRRSTCPAVAGAAVAFAAGVVVAVLVIAMDDIAVVFSQGVPDALRRSPPWCCSACLCLLNLLLTVGILRRMRARTATSRYRPTLPFALRPGSARRRVRRHHDRRASRSPPPS